MLYTASSTSSVATRCKPSKSTRNGRNSFVTNYLGSEKRSDIGRMKQPLYEQIEVISRRRYCVNRPSWHRSRTSKCSHETLLTPGGSSCRIN